MVDTWLFDWGNTLMVDFREAQGKMCDWRVVEAVDGAEQVLNQLSKKAHVYVATGAADSTESDIKRAFERVGLSRYISRYFCKSNLGLSKDSPEFFPAILTKLGKKASEVAMVGDHLEKDIFPAARIGIQTFWLTSSPTAILPKNTKAISSLSELCIYTSC